MNKEFQYELCDSSGSNAVWLPIIIPVEGIFYHEFGTYKVAEHFQRTDGTFLVICERHLKETHPILK